MTAWVIRRIFASLPVRNTEHNYVASGFSRKGEMLIAQAQMEDLPIASNEEVFGQYGVSRLW